VTSQPPALALPATPTQPGTPVVVAVAEQTGASVAAALDHLTALGGCWRGDWSDFDGRTLRMQIGDARAIIERAVAGEDVSDAILRDRIGNGMCPDGGSHWAQYCADGGCSPANGDSGEVSRG